MTAVPWDLGKKPFGRRIKSYFLLGRNRWKPKKMYPRKGRAWTPREVYPVVEISRGV